MPANYDMLLCTNTIKECMASETAGTNAQSYAIEQNLKIIRKIGNLVRRLKDLVLHPFRKKNKRGYILANEFVRPRAKGPEGMFSFQLILLLY